MKISLAVEQHAEPLPMRERERLFQHLIDFARRIVKLETILEAHGIDLKRINEQNGSDDTEDRYLY